MEAGRDGAPLELDRGELGVDRRVEVAQPGDALAEHAQVEHRSGGHDDREDGDCRPRDPPPGREAGADEQQQDGARVEVAARGGLVQLRARQRSQDPERECGRGGGQCRSEPPSFSRHFRPVLESVSCATGLPICMLAAN